jgi:hypothetical protein
MLIGVRFSGLLPVALASVLFAYANVFEAQPHGFSSSLDGVQLIASTDDLSATSGGSAEEKWSVTPAGESHQEPFSRVGIGANISPLGIGINGTTVLSDYFDARLMGNFLTYSSPRFEIEGYRAQATLHLASVAASLDWYPLKSVFRFSPGLMFYNGNHFSADAVITPGTDFAVNGQTFYSATANAATGAKPFEGSGVLGLNGNRVAFTAAFGFGKFVPRSNRHWSFPAEFGVVFMGTPTVNAATSGWVCLDRAQTLCSDVNDTANPIGKDFNTAFQAQLAKWRSNVSGVTVYPMFSYSVVYSFNVR